MMKVLVVVKTEPEYRERMLAVSPELEFNFEYSPEAVRAADIIIGNAAPCDLRGAKRLRLLQLSMAGTDGYLDAGVLPAGAILTNVTGAFGLAISEHMLASVLTLYKKLHLYRDNQLRGVWLDRGEVRSIEGATVLTVGLGDIGGSFARRVKALGAYNIGIRRCGTDKPPYMDELYLSGELDRVLGRADIVALSLPNTPETAGLFNRERIFSMKDGAVLVNVGRGNVLDSDALCDAVDCGKLYGAALDVTVPEPLPPDNRIYRTENILLTPHVSGFFHLRRTYENIMEICIENLRRYVNGEPLMNIIDFGTGYRKL